MKNKLNIEIEYQFENEKEIVLNARKYILNLLFEKYNCLIKAS